MSINDDSIPEGKKKELLDMAYNKVPEGAEYDVFSENTKEAKPFLLYDDILPENPTKVRKEQRDESDAPQDMFAENNGTVKPTEQNLKREYLNALYQGGIDLSKDEIRMTRSQYIAEYNEINGYYDGEKKKSAMNFLWTAVVLAFCLAVLIMIERLQLSINGNAEGAVYLFMLLNGIRTGVFVANPVVCGFFFISSVKSLKSVKKSREKALKQLEEKKQEFMLLGLYDTAN